MTTAADNVWCMDVAAFTGRSICIAGTLNLREWTIRHHMARVDSAGVDNAGVVKCV